MQNGYFADIYGVDFINDSNDVVSGINSWVSEKTNGLIPKLFDRLDPTTNAVLANALYLNAKWTKPFIGTDSEMNFTGSRIVGKTGILSREASLVYASNDYYERVDLSYGKGIYKASFVLPKNASDPYSMVNADALKDILSASGDKKFIDLRLPKFEVDGSETPLNLNKIYENMGVTGLGNFVSNGLYTAPVNLLLSIKQKSFIKFAEKGSEGAAVSYGNMETDSGPNAPKPMFIDFDRPFMFFVTETIGGNCIFAGKVMNL